MDQISKAIMQHVQEAERRCNATEIRIREQISKNFTASDKALPTTSIEYILINARQALESYRDSVASIGKVEKIEKYIKALECLEQSAYSEGL